MKQKIVRFVSNFRHLNKKLKHETYPIPNINETLLKLEVFWYDTSLDLNMGYDHIQLTEDASNLCMIIKP